MAGHLFQEEKAREALTVPTPSKVPVMLRHLVSREPWALGAEMWAPPQNLSPWEWLFVITAAAVQTGSLQKLHFLNQMASLP